MKKRDRLIVLSGCAVNLTLTYSNNLGAWSVGTPYAVDDIEYDPLSCLDDCANLARELGLDLELSKYKVEKAMLKVVCAAAMIGFKKTKSSTE